MFQFFDRIYCINLDTRPDRWEHVQREFGKLGIAERIERFPAIHRTVGAEGCYLSHLACLERAEKDGVDTVLIFEDDVQFMGTEVASILESALGSLARLPMWELLYLGGRLVYPAKRVGPNLIKSRLWSSHAYAVHRRALSKIARSNVPIDVWYSEHLLSFCVAPMVAVQAESRSDVTNHHIGWKRSVFEREYERFADMNAIDALMARVKWHTRFAQRKLSLNVAKLLGNFTKQ